jgi:hypothetical protein
MEDVLNLPGKYPEKKMVIVFDEFQDIKNIQEDLPVIMRSIFQFHNHVSYVFCGSRRHMLMRMFTDKDEPFYKSAKLMKISKIPEKDMTGLVRRGFARGKIRMDPELPGTIIRITDNIPYHVQQLAHGLWFNTLSSRNADSVALESTVDNILHHHWDYYSEIWKNVSRGQRGLLEAIAKKGGKNILSHEYIVKNSLTSVSAAAKNVKILVEKTLLSDEEGEYRFQDPFFRMWIRRNI